MKLDTTVRPHRRFNPLTGRWVLVSPQRASRPWSGQHDRVAPAMGLTHDPGCHLCAGNRRSNGTQNPLYEGVWVFDNDFPALHPVDEAFNAATAGAAAALEDPLFRAEPLAGRCRVICFSPDHSRSLPQLDPPAVRALVDCWAEQSAELGRDHAWVQVFENKGAMMGCSNPHPHGQVWASQHVPDEPSAEDERQRDYHAEHGRPLLWDLAQRESGGDREVVATEHWLAIVPWWATWPFETLLLPRFRVQRLEQLGSAQRDDLVLALRELTARYDNLFGCSFPYSMGWHGAPHLPGDPAHWQLHAHFYPPLLRSATVRKFMVGYEMLADMQRDLTAEQAARQLRAMSPVHYSLDLP
ncbi:MAG: galactose-phosphate uridylyltransferase [Pseudomonadota bacterium]|jgi:UDPglucose--hexose-1-phosphate uridylyltransferase